MTKHPLCARCGAACDLLVLIVHANSAVPVGWCPTCIDEQWMD